LFTETIKALVDFSAKRHGIGNAQFEGQIYF